MHQALVCKVEWVVPSQALCVVVQLWDVPPNWSLKDAATVPVAYLTAYYALVMRGRMTKNSKVLIHSGTGAVGLAAIRIALYRGAEVSQTLLKAGKCTVSSG